jgi:ribonuclease HIII
MDKKCFTCDLNLALAEMLKLGLVDQGFTLTQPPYTLFSGQKKGVSCTLYASGKLVVQGKDMAEFIEFYLEPEILKSFVYTNKTVGLDTGSRIGIDESGKGDLFGPLCVAGVQAAGAGIEKLVEMGVADSKTLNDKKILEMAPKIRAGFAWHVIRLGPEKYNELYPKFKNLNTMLAWGHAATIDALVQKTGCRRVIIDQFAAEWQVETALKKKNVEVDLTQRTKGEEDVVVAAASIIARETFLLALQKMEEEWGVHFQKGASSLTKKAGKAFIEKHGIEMLPKVCKMHFKTVGELM